MPQATTADVITTPNPSTIAYGHVVGRPQQV